MQAKEMLCARRSVRRFKDEEVSPAAIESIVDVAKMAPSWKNTQTVRYIAVTDEEIKAKIADECIMGFAGNKRTIDSAPCLVVVASIGERSGYERDGSFSTSKETHWQSFDAGIATQTFCLTAYEQGYATCIMGIFDEAKVKDALGGIPEGQSVSALIALGKADEEPDAPPRKDIETLLSFK